MWNQFKRLMLVVMFSFFVGIFPAAIRAESLPDAGDDVDMEEIQEIPEEASGTVSEAASEVDEKTKVRPAFLGEWWIPEKPYDLWKKEQLEEWIKALTDFMAEIPPIPENQEKISSVAKQIKEARKMRARMI